MSESKPVHQWHALGQALKALRKGQHQRVKEIRSRSREEFSDRTYRNYESGKERIGRERLLKFLTRSFNVRSNVEINRYLKLGHFLPLTPYDIEQFGIDLRTPLPLGNPADVRVKASTLTVTDGSGQTLWHYQFPEALMESSYAEPNARRKIAFADLDGDGGVETLFVYLPATVESVGATLYCFSETGDVKWEFTPGRALIDDTRRKYLPPYFISSVHVIPFPNSNPRILVSSNHYAHNPNQVAMLDASGQMISEYWHSGHLLSIVHADLNGDGFEEILLGGPNHGYRRAMIHVFDSREVSGASQQPDLQILGFPKSVEKATILFPRTCLAGTALQNRITEIRLVGGNRILVAVSESTSDPRRQGLMLYEFNYQLKLVSAQADVRLRENHQALEEQDILDHPWSDEEAQQLGRQVIVRGGL